MNTYQIRALQEYSPIEYFKLLFTNREHQEQAVIELEEQMKEENKERNGYGQGE